MSSEFDDDYYEQSLNERNMILNVMGIGTFIILMMAGISVAVYGFTYYCDPGPKIAVRGIYILIYIITVLILYYAPKEDMYTISGIEPNVFDHSIIPRIALSLLIGIFAVVAAAMAYGENLVPKQLSTVDHEYSALWLEDTLGH